MSLQSNNSLKMEINDFLLILFVVLLSYLCISSKKPYNFPPGPFFYPYIGCLPQLKKLAKALGGQYLALNALSKKYETNVLGMKLGKDYVVAVFSYPIIKKVLSSQEYEGRPKGFFEYLRSMGTNKGVTCVDGELWKIQRNFVVGHLRNLGFGKNRMEEMILDESKEILEILSENPENVHVSGLLSPAILNVLWALTTGSRFSIRDPHLQKLLNLLNDRAIAFDMSGGTLSYHPWLRFVMPERSGYNLIQKLNADLKKLFVEIINEHEKNWTEDRDDDLIYSFITEMKKGDNDSTFTMDQLIMICFDIFVASTQTTSHTLEFAFMVMILHPDVQEKIHECLDATFDKSEQLNYSDRYRVPYVQAVLLEVERMYATAAINAPRRVLRDTTLENYKIPKDTMVLMSLQSVHHEKDYWKDPEVYRPERFLDENGKFVPSERVIPFGLGKRRCIGEVLAKSSIFLLFVEIMRNYKIVLTPGTKMPTGVPLAGITLVPEPYRATFIPKL